MHQSFATPASQGLEVPGTAGGLSTLILLSRCRSSAMVVRAFDFLPNIAGEEAD